MAPHEPAPAVTPAEELGAYPTTSPRATRRVRSLNCATVVSSVQETHENASPKSDVRSVFSSISQKSLRSGISVSLLKKMAKVGSSRAATNDIDARSVPSAGQGANPSEKSRVPAFIQISPKILGGIICEHMFDDELSNSRNHGCPKSADVGYIRMLKPKTRHLVKSRPLLDTPVRVESEEQGVEVVQKNKFIVWDKETTLEVALPSSSCEGGNGYELVVEVGVIHNDATCALGTAIITLREGELEKMRFLFCPKPLKLPNRTAKNSRHREVPNVKYRLDSCAAFAVEVQVTDKNVNRCSDAPKHEKDSPLNAKLLLSDLAARFGANSPKPSVYAAGVVEEIKEMRISPRSASSRNRVGFDRAVPFPSPNDDGKDAQEGTVAEDTDTDGSSSEEEENRLPYVEMTSYSLDTFDEAGVETQNCLLFVGNIGAEEHFSSSDDESSSGSSSATGDCSAFSDASSLAHLSVADKELATILKKREAISPKKIMNTTRTMQIPTLGFLKEGPSSPTTRARKKSLKDKLRRVLEFNNRGAAKLPSRPKDDLSCSEKGEANSILAVELGSASSLKCFKTTSNDFAAQTCCSPFQNGGPMATCSRYMGTTPEGDGIQLSRNKVTQLAKALKMSPSTLVNKIEQLDE